jgi:hypothetical protein
MKLIQFLKLLFLHCRLNIIRIQPDSWIVVSSKDVEKAVKLANEINKLTGKWLGIIVAGEEISVSTVKEIPEDFRNKLLAALLKASE